MWIDRVSSLTPKGSTREASRDWKAGLFLTCLAFSLTGCVAQQSDLVKMEKDFEGKIIKLGEEKKALAQVLTQANQDIADSQAALAKQKTELNELMNELMKARAQLKSELRSLREENLPKVSGELETQLHRLNQTDRKVNQTDRRVDALAGEVSTLTELREQRDAEMSNRITNLGKTLEAARRDFEKAMEQRGQRVSKQFVEFQGSLVRFKEALTKADKRLGEERKRATSSETKIQKIRQDFAKRLQTFGEKLDSDTQALRTYLETEVRTTIESINTVLNEGNRNLKTDIDAQAARLSKINVKLGTELTGLQRTDALHGKNLEEVVRSLAQLRDALRKTGTQLGTEVDSQGKETAKRIKQLQSRYEALAKKLDVGMKSLHGHLEKQVRPSLESIAKTIEQEKSLVSQKLINLKTGLQRVEQTTASHVTQTQTKLEAEDKRVQELGEHVQELGEAVAAMREVLDSMAGMLGERSDHQMKQVGQLVARMERLEAEQSSGATRQASNAQAVSAHLDQVTTSVQSFEQSFEQFKTAVSTSLNEQADRLQAQARQTAKSLEASSAVPGLHQELLANVKQLNDVTRSIAQLKSAVKAIGDKLGSKVDAHESRLGEIERALKNFRQPAPPKPPDP